MGIKRSISTLLVFLMLVALFSAYPVGFASAASGLRSDVYHLDSNGGYVYDVVAGTTVAEFAGNFKNSAKIVVYSSDGTTLEDNAFMATNYSVSNGNETLTVIVKGDLNGDGTVSTADSIVYSLHLKGLSLLSGALLLAGDVDYDREVVASDYLIYKQHLAGLLNINNTKHPDTGSAPSSYTVTFVAGENGYITGTSFYEVEADTAFNSLEVPEPTANAGYVFYGWTPEFPETVDSDMVFTAVFEKDSTSWHTISFKAGENGSLSGDTVFVDVFAGTDFEDAGTMPTVIPDAGYKFIGWEPELPEFVTESAEYVAIFEYDPTQYVSVTFIAGTHGTLEGAASFSVLKGTAWSEISVPTCVPDEYYIFNSWSSEFPETIEEDLTFTANFSANPNISIKNYASSANGGSYMVTSGNIREDFADSFAASTGFGSGYLNDGIHLTANDDNWIEISRVNSQVNIAVELAEPITMTRAIINLGTRYDSTNRKLPKELTVYVGKTISEATEYFGGATIDQYVQKGEYGHIATVDGEAEDVQYILFVFDMSPTDTFIARFGELEVYGSTSNVVSTYDVTFSAGENGSLNGNTSYTVDEGTLWSTITVPVPQAEIGYKFTGWTPKLPDSSDSISENLEFIANFEYDSEQWATVTFDCEIGGTLDGDREITVLKGTDWSEIPVPSVIPDTGYDFKAWEPLFPAIVTEDVSFTATFESEEVEDVTITFTAGNGGTVSGTTSFTVQKGTAWSEITVPSYVADAGYKFKAWTPEFPETITANATYTATFERDDSQYATVKFVAGENGVISGTGEFTVLKGTAWSEITVPTYTANVGYKFDSWSPAFPEVINGDATFTANFVVDASQYVTINFKAGENGTLGGTTTFTVLKGTAWSSITVPNYTADPGYKFDGWTPEFPSAVNEDATYVANFVYDATQYATITFTVSEGGSLNGTTTFTVLKGSAWNSVTVPTPVADDGYTFKAWNTSFPTTINADANFIAEFELIPTYSVVFVAGDGGTINGTWYFEGIYADTLWSDVVTVPTPVPGDGYEFDSWSPSLPDSSFKIVGDLTYTAVFKKSVSAVTRNNYASSANGGTYAYIVGSDLSTNTDSAFTTISTESYRSGWSQKTVTFGNGLLNNDAVVSTSDGAWVEKSRANLSEYGSNQSNVIIIVVKLDTVKSDIERVVVNCGTMADATNRGLPNTVTVKYSTAKSYGSSNNMSWKNFGSTSSYEQVGGYGYLATIDGSVSGSVKYLQITLSMSTYFVGRIGEVQVLGPEINTVPRTVTFLSSEGGTLSGNTSVTVANGTSWGAVNVPTPVPNKGYTFSHWSPTLPASTSAVNANATYTAVFVKEASGVVKNYALSTNGGQYMITNGTVQTGYPDSFASGDGYGAGRLNDGNLLSADADPWVEVSRYNNSISITVKLSTSITVTKLGMNLGLRYYSTNRVLPDSVTAYVGTDENNMTVFGSSSTFSKSGEYGYLLEILGNAENVTVVRFDCPMSNYIARFGEVEVYGFAGPAIPTYNITFSAGDHGSIDGETVQTVEEGATWADISVPTPTPDPGYVFVGWTPVLPDDDTEITEDISFVANFQYDASLWATITFNAGAGGSLSGTDVYDVVIGTSWSDITVPTPVADNGYMFVDWTPAFPTKVTGNAVFTANFAVKPKEQYTITFTAGNGGTLDGVNSITVEEGTLWSEITVPTPVPNEGYDFVSWSPVLPAATATINGNATYSAVFAQSGDQSLEGVIYINGINAGQFVSAGSHIYTSTYSSYFTATYWQVFVAGYSEAKGGYIVTEIFESGATKSVSVPMNGILLAVHMGSETQAACSLVNVGDLLVLSSDIDLDSASFVANQSYVRIYTGDGTTPDDNGGTDEPEPPIGGDEGYTQINYDNVKAMWLSQFDLSGVYTSGSSQRAEGSFRTLMTTILDNCVNMGMNTIIVQVRPNGDSMYPSEYYTMSKYVVGSYGKNATYDPFKIIIELAHARKLSVQAWINPLRLMSTSDITKVSSSYKVGEWYQNSNYNGTYVVQYSSYYYLNPAYEEVRNLIINGAKEICELYDVDGVHMDDYFYPTTDSSFDSKAYNSYTGSLSLANWRRQNLNLLVSGLYDAIKDVDSDILFGISPAGNMNTVYNSQYADVYTWCSTEGYIDYICPQVYFGMLHSSQGFPTCSTGWSNIVKHSSVTLYVGVTLGKAVDGYSGTIDNYAGTTEGKYEWVNNRDVLKDCLIYTRDNLDKCTGIAFFCYQYFYDPVSGSSVTATAEERSNFLPILQSMWQ